MKQYMWIMALLAVACNQPDPNGKLPADIVTNSQSAEGKQPTALPEITFAEKEYNFGKINEGDVVAHTFTFTNTGKADLIISDAQPSCGCTVADFPRHPIKPGETGKIETQFDSKGKAGSPHKSITVRTNCEPSVVELMISGEVTPKK